MFDDLKKFELAGLKRVNTKQQAADIEASKGIDADQILRRKYQKHAQKFFIRNRKAKQLLERLPEPGEVYTVLMSGSFDGWDYVQAAIELAAPRKLAELYVATLGFSEDNAGKLLEQLDNLQIGKVWFNASCMMRDKHGDKFARLSEMLKKRDQKIRATRNHAKLLAMKFDDGSTYCVDGSLNLCSCRNVEQAHVWNDAQLFDFYSAYIKDAAEGVEHVK